MFCNYLEYRPTDKVQSPINSECYTPSSEPFRMRISRQADMMNLIFVFFLQLL
jgi:hypothetical protein